MKKIVSIWGLLFCFFATTSIAQTKDIQQLKKEAQQGNAKAQCDLGYAYFTGNGVTKDEKQAVIWFRKAAENGNITAQSNLAYCYQEGVGIAKDLKQAFVWQKKAAEQGDLMSQSNLGYYYEFGIGVAKNLEQAAAWYQKAANQGSDQAKENLKNLEKKIYKSKFLDAEAFELIGKVKRCYWISDGNMNGYDMAFDNTGKLSSIGTFSEEKISNIKHSEKGYLISIESTDEMINKREFVYRNNKLTKTKLTVTAGINASPSLFETIYSSAISSALSFERVTEFFYSNNIVVKCISITKDADGEKKVILNFSNYKFDKQGNWIARTVKEKGKTYIEKRTIEYY